MIALVDADGRAWTYYLRIPCNTHHVVWVIDGSGQWIMCPLCRRIEGISARSYTERIAA